ncbi:NAD(P)H-binding protein, partial [Rhodococcus hoagii]|nr:NAD(P)H-binding protein [Prescottella equi]
VADVVRGAGIAVVFAPAPPDRAAARPEGQRRSRRRGPMADAAERAGVRRFIQVSSFGAGEPIPTAPTRVFAAYLGEDRRRDDLRRRDGLDWTILRPGGLTDDDPTGEVTLTEPPLDAARCHGAMVAAVIAALLASDGDGRPPRAVRRTLMLTEGSFSIEDALAALTVNPPTGGG